MLPSDFFAAVPMAGIPALAALRNVVLERTTKRMPKWQFRIADDVTIQIQPKPVIKKLRGSHGDCGGFECEAVQDPGDYLGTRSMKFFMFLDPDGGWHFKMTRIGYRHADPEEEREPDGVGRRDRMIGLLPKVFQTLRPGMMLRAGCLVCGKTLTDPISQARWIGPECNDSAGALNPFLIRLQETTTFIEAA